MPGEGALFLGDPQSARFLAGGLSEVERLFGSPLPLLPPSEFEKGRQVYFIHTHPRLRTLLHRFLQGLLAQIGVDTPVQRQESAERDQAEYEAALGRILHSARATDRRLGLLNLFWLAHSREVAECLKDLEAKNPAVRKLKYSLHPLLSSVYRRLDLAARREFERVQPDQVALLAGTRENPSLVDAVIEDGFAFTEASIQALDFNQFLASNKRYRLPADVFFEIYQVLLRETEKRIKDGDRGLMARIGRHLAQLPKEQWTAQPGIVKIMMNSHVMTYLLADAWTVGTKLMATGKIKAETERRKPAEVVDAFLDLVAGVKRFEAVSGIRERIVLLQERDLDESASRGRRVYEFSESAQVLNNAVNATVLFLDLRGFTKTSEGQISERDLTRELYTVFDAFVPHVLRFAGTIDKFLGDGIMMTFGTEHGDPLDPLNALRVAILCQETLRGLREAGKTYFKMGIAIHYGRVYLARFIADEATTQATVIGRNVNLAGRLSSAAKKPMDEDDRVEMTPVGPVRASGLHMVVDKAGTLFNEGIALSRDTLVQLEAQLPLVHRQEGSTGVMEYFDEQIGRRILIRYAGDAKFKGVLSSFPVYEVDYEV
jgi:class 3 adenylate cyclase